MAAPQEQTIVVSQPSLPHFLFDRLALVIGQAAATVGRTERRAAQSALTEKLTMRQARELAVVVTLDRPLVILGGASWSPPAFEN